MTKPARRPFWLVHRGHVQCHGLLFSSRYGVDWSRIAIHYRHSCTLYRLGESQLALIYASPEFLDTSSINGSALVRYGEHFSTLPLSTEDCDLEEFSAQQIVDAVGGKLRHRRISDRDRVELSDWFTLEDWAFEVAEPLSLPIEPQEALNVVAVNRRDALDHCIGEPPPEAAMFDGRGSPVTAGHGRAGVRGTLVLIGRAIQSVIRILARRFLIAGDGRGQRTTGQTKALAPTRRDPRLPLHARLASWLRRQIWQSKLGHLFGAAQSRYLGKMLELFERGDLEEALRHAIPTSKVASTGGAVPKLLPGVPRQNLEVSGVRGRGQSIGLSSELFAHLRATYEAAFAKLVSRGQIAEAAFVLSQLLEDDARAVSFLESHGRLLEAAKLAELRELPAGLVVRQWFMAGDTQRAIDIARRDGAFEDAILRLKGNPAAQASLRLSWADHLATAGNYTGAALLIGDLKDGRKIGKVWLDRAIEIGGVGGAQALGVKARLFPEEFKQVRELSVHLIDEQGADAAAARVALARELTRGDGAECRAIARGVVRALVRDAGDAAALLPRSELVELARFSEDGALHADLPAAPSTARAKTLELTAAPHHVVVRERDRGTATVLDLRALSRGRQLVARGEAGCSLLGADGRVIHHFDVPSECLVFSSNGDRALALAHRDDITLVSRINLLTRTAAAWCDLRATAFASHFDGAEWYVAIKNRVCAIDATRDQVTSTWRSAATDEPIVQVAWTPKTLVFSTRTEECWSHQLSPHRLVKREQVKGWPVLGPNGARATLCAVAGEGTELIALVDVPSKRQLPVAAAEGMRVRLLDASEQWVVVAVHLFIDVPEAVDVKLISLERFSVMANIHLEGTKSVCARLNPFVMTVGDDCGRVLVVELATLRERMNVRI